MLEGL
jgi:hypothetical protein